MTAEIFTNAERKMARAVEVMERDFQGIRTGRASTSLVERIHVDYYGTMTALNQLASISVPEAHQIVKYTFDNIDFDFLPAQWLVRLGNVRATMTMHQPFPDVWLPRDLEFLVDAQVATGRFDVRWSAEYRDYRQADVTSKFRVGPER